MQILASREIWYISEQSTNYRSTTKEMAEFASNSSMRWSPASHGIGYVKGL